MHILTAPACLEVIDLRGVRHGIGEKRWETVPAEGALPPGDIDEEDNFRPGPQEKSICQQYQSFGKKRIW